MNRLLFVSPRFLFPADSGGLIRTTQILRGLKGGVFEIVLASPGSEALARTWSSEIETVCDRWSYWPETERGMWFSLRRMRHIFSAEPIPVATDHSAAGSDLVERELAQKPDVVVFDFPHSVVLAPNRIDVPSVMFTHNVEAEIFRRHIDVTRNPVLRNLWRSQTKKMERFEATALARFDGVVAVAERDREEFISKYRLSNVRVISTGVDLNFFEYAPPADDGCVLFLGSMDWLANIDAMDWFMDEIWPLVTASRPDAKMKIVGRHPPAALVNRAKSRQLKWEFTGFVEDVRDHVKHVSAFVIPLRVGGGTRIKVYEAIAMGMPVVSTSIGVEGLPLQSGQHYLNADDSLVFAQSILRLMADGELGRKLSIAAYEFVKRNCSSERAAKEFEEICSSVLPRATGSEHV